MIFIVSKRGLKITENRIYWLSIEIMVGIVKVKKSAGGRSTKRIAEEAHPSTYVGDFNNIPKNCLVNYYYHLVINMNKQRRRDELTLVDQPACCLSLFSRLRSKLCKRSRAIVGVFLGIMRGLGRAVRLI